MTEGWINVFVSALGVLIAGAALGLGLYAVTITIIGRNHEQDTD